MYMFHPYGLFIGIAIVVGWGVAEKIYPKINKVLPCLFISSFIGARLYHVIDMWEYYSLNLVKIIAVWNGGLGIWGGILGGTISVMIYYHINNNKKEIWKALDSIAVGLPIAQAIGRLGNGANHEFVEKIWIMPWWGVEAVLDFVLFVILLRWSKVQKNPKLRVSTYLMGYGIIRFVLEFFRINNWVAWGLGVAQWASLTSVVIGLLIWQGNAQD